VVIALALAEPWATLLLVLGAYLCCMPLSISTHRRLTQQRPMPSSAGVNKDADADHL
jgi:hypothetical protein